MHALIVIVVTGLKPRRTIQAWTSAERVRARAWLEVDDYKSYW